MEGMDDPQSEDRPPKKEYRKRIYRMCLFENVFIFSMEIKFSPSPTHTQKTATTATKPFSTICIQLCVLNWVFSEIRYDFNEIETRDPFHMIYRFDMWHETSKIVRWYFNQTLFQNLFTCAFYGLLLRKSVTKWIRKEFVLSLEFEKSKSLSIKYPISNTFK